MTGRLELHTLLEELLESRNVYFQPPESIKMKYPAIVYNLDNIDSVFANDELYMSKKNYIITIIDEDPDSDLIDRMLRLSARFNRYFRSDNLNHYVFTLEY